MKKFFVFLFVIFINFDCFANNHIHFKLSNPRMHGKEVEKIQTALFNCNLLLENEIDGWFGLITENSIKRLQDIIGIDSNGIVDSELFNLLSNSDFQKIIHNEVSYQSKFIVDEFHKVLDCSGYDLFVYRNESNNIFKYIRAYWQVATPNYEKEIQYIEEYYFIDNRICKKLLKIQI